MQAGGATALLLACLLYNLHVVQANPSPGITYDARWEVMEIMPCDTAPARCPNEGSLRLHDQLLQVGPLAFDDYAADTFLVPFGGYSAGDTVPLTVLRAGQTVQVEWLMPETSALADARFVVVSLLVYGSFWLAGTFVLLYLRPEDDIWRLLIALYYLTAVWLAVGLNAPPNVAHSQLLLRLVGWMMIPVMIHLHLVVPGRLIDPRRRWLVIPLYGAALFLLILQLLGLLPRFAYLGGILFAALTSVGLLGYRLLTPRPPAERLAARVMLVGIVFAFGPGLILSAIPLILDVGTAGIVGAELSILALPMLPMFYTYAIYKHRLGQREYRFNRLLVQYTLFLLYLSLLTLGFVMMTSWIRSANDLMAVLALIGLAVFVALLPIRRPVQATIDRLTYGTRYSHREILADFAERIPAALNRNELVQLLKNELMPELEIRQSALYVQHDNSVQAVYRRGVAHDEGPATKEELGIILADADRFRSVNLVNSAERADRLAWVRLAVPLRVQDRPTGVWLFGRRAADNFYSQDDIELLDRLAGVVAVTLESSALFDALTNELAIGEQVEARLEAQSKRLSLLHEIDRAILAAGSAAEIAQAAINGISQLVPCIRASVLLFDSDREIMTVLASQGRGTNIVAENDSLPLEGVAISTELMQGRIFVTDDVLETTADSVLAMKLAPAGIRSVVSVPLMTASGVFGALCVASDEPAVYTPTHLNIVEEVATSVALAIHNAGLREALNKNTAELQILSARLIDAQETERKRLSHELHDEMGQILTAVSLNLAAIERNLPRADNAALRNQLADANESVARLTEQVRSLSLDLRPAMLHDLGLIPTLRWYLSDYSRRRDTEVSFTSTDMPDRLAENVEITAFRVVQEALTNVSRHAQASKINLQVARCDGYIEIKIEDNGRGFEPESLQTDLPYASGIGLTMMRQRLSALNGNLTLSSRPGSGTRITAEIPFEETL